MLLKNIALVASGGALGCVARYLVSEAGIGGPSFLATLLVNVAGSFLIGCLAAYGLKNLAFGNELKLLLVTGFCGGFTTLSAFSLENVALLNEGKVSTALFYTFATVAFGIVACFLGFKIVQ